MLISRGFLTQNAEEEEEEVDAFRNTFEMSRQWWSLYRYEKEHVDRKCASMSVAALKVQIECRCL